MKILKKNNKKYIYKEKQKEDKKLFTVVQTCEGKKNVSILYRF